jgi:prepilin-type processing-associated H-X9-DG protein/prepilin-type N-terminal cleavage/methylation domain-containing protein
VRPRPPGFTLVEILVVLGIIALLTAVLVPALAGARGAADALTCQASLRQWAQAMQCYAQDHRGCLPRRGQGVQSTTMVDRPEDWFNALPPVMRMARFSDLAAQGRIPRPPGSGLWLCPQAVDNGAQFFFAYGMNMRLSTWMAGVPARLSGIPMPAAAVFMADAAGDHCSVLPAAQPYSPVARHRGKVNISFLDGHVAAFSGQYVGCGVGDPDRPDIHWIVPNDPWAGPAN